LGVDSYFKHVTFDLFEVTHVSKKTLAKNLIEKNITWEKIAYVKKKKGGGGGLTLT
jgi:hypothetical protein